MQLLTPAAVMAKTNGREEIVLGDLEEVGDLFLDAKASAKLLTEQAISTLLSVRADVHSRGLDARRACRRVLTMHAPCVSLI